MRSSSNYAWLLWLLLTLFILRVAGQLLVAFNIVSLLPPMNEWQSGFLPYPLLLASQITIIIVFSKVCVDFSRGRGFFVSAKPLLAMPLQRMASLYLVGMPVRYGVYMALVPEARWFHGTIPIVLHMVLATFLLTVSHYQRRVKANPAPIPGQDP